MKFLKQIKFEMKNILLSKFLLIIGIIIMLISVAAPIIGLISRNSAKSNHNPVMYEGDVRYSYAAPAYGGKEMYPGGQGQPITIDGVVIDQNNPFYWSLSNCLSQQQSIQNNQMTFTHPESANVLLDLVNEEIKFYMHFVNAGIKDYDDYRQQLQGDGMTNLFDKFMYEHASTDKDVLYEVMQQFGMVSYDQEVFNKKYISITSEARLAALNTADDYLTKLYDVVDNSNFKEFIDLSIQQQQHNIKNNEDQIAIFQKDIVDNPQHENDLNLQIDDLQKQNEVIKNNNIPMLQYRLDNNIIPGKKTWQNSAISDIEDSENWLAFNKLLSEEDYNKPQNQGLIQQYGSYNKYKAAMIAQQNQYQNKELVAKKCLDAGKPDMKYVPDGARSITVQFLDFSVVIALFAVLLGGWIVASEFQLGTIRLLLIRPKTRTKILMSKFLASLIICLVMYIAGCFINAIINGICFGFSDFAYPNYSVSGATGFFAVYLPELLTCSITIIFAFCVAFMLSVLTKNIAVSIAVPVVCYIGCFLSLNILAYRQAFDWIAYTPIPYVQLSSFFMPNPSMAMTYMNSPVHTLIENGAPISLAYGIIMLLVLSGVCVFFSIFAFRKRDITN